MSETEQTDTDPQGQWWNPLARGEETDDEDKTANDTATDDSSDEGRTWNPVTKLREYFAEDLPAGTLVDGTEALFIDPAATARHLDEYRLVVLVNDAYPEPAVLYAGGELELAEDAALVKAGPSALARFGDRRVIVRDFAIATAERAATVDRDRRRELPDALAGETVPAQRCQHYELYDALVGAADQAQRH